MELKRHTKEKLILDYLDSCMSSVKGEVNFRKAEKIIDIEKFCETQKSLILKCSSQRIYDNTIRRVVDLKNYLEKTKA